MISKLPSDDEARSKSFSEQGYWAFLAGAEGYLRSVKAWFWLIFCVCAQPLLGKGPEPAALEFLERARSGSLDLEPGGDTAIQPTTSEKKREQIRREIDRLEDDLKGSELEVGDVKLDGDFAAVMIFRGGGIKSDFAQVFPVALVKRGEKWLPAPVLASYENAVEAYTLPIRGRLSMLEDWMLRKRVTDLRDLIEDSAGRMKAKIEEAVPRDLLKDGEPGEIAEGFIKACQEGDGLALLGFLGGLSEPLPTDWEVRKQAVQAALEARSEPDSPWYLLASPDVVRVRVLEDIKNGDGLISYGCLDPRKVRARGTIGIISVFHLSFKKDPAGLWRVDPQEALLEDDARALAEESEFDVDLLDKFPEVFRKSKPLVGAATFEKAEAALVEVLKGGSLRDLLELVDFGKGGKEGRIACAEAAKLWWSINAPGRIGVPVRLDSKSEGRLGVVAFQWFSVSKPDRYELKSLFFRKQSEGWVWSPGVVPEAEREEQKVLSEWAKAGEDEWRISWRNILMKESVRLPEEGGNENALPTDQEAKEVVGAWIRALDGKMVQQSLGLSAWFGKKGDLPLRLLRNLNYEISEKGDVVKTVGKVYRGKSWVGVRVTTEEKGEKAADRKAARKSFVVVQMTGEGARVIPELDLLEESTRTRGFLNNDTFKRLGASVGKESVEELRELFSEFLEDEDED